MSPDRRSPDEKPTETSRTASRGAIAWMIPIAIAALALMLVGFHFIGSIK